MRFLVPEEYEGGWFIGHMMPPRDEFKTDQFEVAYKRFKAGEKSDGHYHTNSTEINIVVEGAVAINWGTRRVAMAKGCVFVYHPYDRSEVEFLEDSALVVIRTPSVNDKTYDSGDDTGADRLGHPTSSNQLC